MGDCSAPEALLGTGASDAGTRDAQIHMKMSLGKTGRAGRTQPPSSRRANTRAGTAALSHQQLPQKGPDRPAFSLAPGRPLQEPDGKPTARPLPLRRSAKSVPDVAEKTMPPAKSTADHAAAPHMRRSATQATAAAQGHASNGHPTADHAAALRDCGPAQTGKCSVVSATRQQPAPSKPGQAYRNVRAKVDTGRTRAKTRGQQSQPKQAHREADVAGAAPRAPEPQSALPATSDKAGAAELVDDGNHGPAASTEALQPGMLSAADRAYAQQVRASQILHSWGIFQSLLILQTIPMHHET